jgi:integrase
LTGGLYVQPPNVGGHPCLAGFFEDIVVIFVDRVGELVAAQICGELHRVFPGPGQMQPWPLPRIGGGGPLLYNNFRNRVWVPTLKRLGLPPVTPHSARHSFISTLGAQGVEIGLAAKLAGHANANVTLGYYTHAVRGGEDALAALERAYTA